MIRKLKKEKLSFDKYDIYSKAVQSPDTDVVFLRDLYKELRGKRPKVLREDFCGTFLLSCEWVKLASSHRAYGLDIDSDPIRYGRANYFPQLSLDQQSRLVIKQSSVLASQIPHGDIIAAFNFSHYIFKEREELLRYFSKCYKTLNKDGILVADAFGGALCHTSNAEKTKHPGFTYEWEQESFNEIDHHALFHINFLLKGEKRWRKHVFSYDWRMWSLPELQEIMKEAGFRKVYVYWEEADASGEGTGDFFRATKSDECDAWVAYVVGLK